MKSERLMCFAVALLAMAMPVSLTAQDNAKPTHPHQYRHYQLADVGTFGGPDSWLFNPGVVRLGLLKKWRWPIVG